MSDRQAWLKAYYTFLAAMPDLSDEEPFAAWMAFAGAHDGRCAICFLRAGRLVEDHDHCTGLVRGLLCRSCNARARSGVAHAPVRQDRFAPFTIYCQYPPTAAANVRWIYQGSLDDPAPRLRDVIWFAGPDGLYRYERDLFAVKVGL